jgi:hypothetical protein
MVKQCLLLHAKDGGIAADIDAHKDTPEDLHRDLLWPNFIRSRIRAIFLVVSLRRGSET